MGHRALVAYERPDSTYNIHYTHWGGLNLRLKQAITSQTPFGGDTPSEQQQATYEHLQTATSADADAFEKEGDTRVWTEPEVVGVTFDDVLDTHLNYCSHEALYVVDADLRVTAYRTHWFGLQYDCESITDGARTGNGAVRTVRWYNGEPVGDGYVQGEFQALRNVVGDMVDRGVFTRESAVGYMEQRLREWTGSNEELYVRTA